MTRADALLALKTIERSILAQKAAHLKAGRTPVEVWVDRGVLETLACVYGSYPRRIHGLEVVFITAPEWLEVVA